jgi:hypothetical protein
MATAAEVWGKSVTQFQIPDGHPACRLLATILFFVFSETRNIIRPQKRGVGPGRRGA